MKAPPAWYAFAVKAMGMDGDDGWLSFSKMTIVASFASYMWARPIPEWVCIAGIVVAYGKGPAMEFARGRLEAWRARANQPTVPAPSPDAGAPDSRPSGGQG